MAIFTRQFASLREVRWGHLHELDYRTNVGTTAWFRRHPEQRLRKLSAWRYLHTFGTHARVAREGHRRGYTPSSDMRLIDMLDSAETFKLRDAGVKKKNWPAHLK